MRLTISSIIGIIVGVFSLLLFFGSFYRMDQGERGVILRNGAIIGLAEPGLNFKWPIIDQVEKISVQSLNRSFDKVAAYSRDQQPAEVRLSVNFRVPPDKVGELYERFGSVDGLLTRLIDPRVYEHFKNVFGQFNAATAIQDRARMNLEVERALRTSITGPVVIESVQVENIDFSEAYERSVEERMLAEVEVAKLEQNAKREQVQAQITVTKAKAAADAVRAEAEAQGDAIKIKGNAEAEAIRVRTEALGQNPNLIMLTQAERWNGVLPTTMIPNSTVPFINTNMKEDRYDSNGSNRIRSSDLGAPDPNLP